MKNLPLIQLVVTEIGLNLAVVFAVLLVNFLVMRIVLGLNLKTFLHEIEEDHNNAVGATFFSISFAMSFMAGRAAASPITETPWLETLGWLALAFGIGAVLAVILSWFFLKLMSRRHNETPMVYLRREVIQQNNGALAFFVAGLALIPIIVTAHITL